MCRQGLSDKLDTSKEEGNAERRVGDGGEDVYFSSQSSLPATFVTSSWRRTSFPREPHQSGETKKLYGHEVLLSFSSSVSDLWKLGTWSQFFAVHLANLCSVNSCLITVKQRWESACLQQFWEEMAVTWYSSLRPVLSILPWEQSSGSCTSQCLEVRWFKELLAANHPVVSKYVRSCWACKVLTSLVTVLCWASWGLVRLHHCSQKIQGLAGLLNTRVRYRPLA